MAVSNTVIRDDFFNDPFFKDWWADFDMPLKTVQFNRQISGLLQILLYQYISCISNQNSKLYDKRLSEEVKSVKII